MARIGDVEFNVISESRPYTSDVTSHPIEKGSDITDHVKLNPVTFNIEGHVGDNENPGEKHLKIRMMWIKRELVKYAGRSMMNDCIIESFTSNVDEGSQRGFRFSLTIRKIDIAKPSTVSLLPVSLKVDMAEVGNAGRVQVQ